MRTKILAKILSASLTLTSRIGRMPFQELRPARGPDRRSQARFRKAAGGAISWAGAKDLRRAHSARSEGEVRSDP
jgi:hypothetical protein